MGDPSDSSSGSILSLWSVAVMKITEMIFSDTHVTLSQRGDIVASLTFK